jgi:hypothetical protein
MVLSKDLHAAIMHITSIHTLPNWGGTFQHSRLVGQHSLELIRISPQTERIIQTDTGITIYAAIE